MTQEMDAITPKEGMTMFLRFQKREGLVEANKVVMSLFPSFLFHDSVSLPHSILAVVFLLYTPKASGSCRMGSQNVVVPNFQHYYCSRLGFFPSQI